MVRKWVLVVGLTGALLAAGFVLWLLRKPGCSVTYWLNPDMACRVLDIREDGRHLVEYFNADTNELRLYIQHNRKDLEIEHPFGKVKAFNPELSQNKVTFNSQDERTLLVNGEVFSITAK